LTRLLELEELRIVEGLLKALVRRARNIPMEQRLAWLYGFALGDASVFIVKNEITLTTPRIDTMLAFVVMALEFSRVVRAYPGMKRGGTPTWYIHAETSPELVQKICKVKKLDIESYLRNRELLAPLTAGLMDSDGSIALSVKKRKRGGSYKYYFEPDVSITNSNKQLLQILRDAWAKHGILFKIYTPTKSGSVGKGGFVRRKDVYRIRIEAQHQIGMYLRQVLPYMQHIERIAKASITLAYIESRIPHKPEIIAKASEVLKQYYEQVLKIKSHNLISKLYNLRKQLKIYKNGTICVSPIKR